ncbi:MAG: cytochrome P460 family protein [Myxococcota bacterium]|nr:cytochrome P460 family protein [Myxococcota bacterium]
MRALWIVILIACGGSTPTTKPPPVDAEGVFGPLEVGADYATYTKLTEKPFLSLDHGNRWVDVYVNAIGLAAYDSNTPIPVGTIVVKTSVLDEHGAPGSVAGPLFIMEKRAPGYAPDEHDWWYALHWADPPAEDAAKFGGPIYWRGKSARVDYCAECHTDYERSLGGLIPSSVLKR